LTRSQNRTVRWRRSPNGGVDSSARSAPPPVPIALDGIGGEGTPASSLKSAKPQTPQKASPGSFDAPHFGHNHTSGPPHLAQNLRPSRLSAPHFEQRIAVPPNGS